MPGADRGPARSATDAVRWCRCRRLSPESAWTTGSSRLGVQPRATQSRIAVSAYEEDATESPEPPTKSRVGAARSRSFEAGRPVESTSDHGSAGWSGACKRPGGAESGRAGGARAHPASRGWEAGSGDCLAHGPLPQTSRRGDDEDRPGRPRTIYDVLGEAGQGL